MSSKGKFYSTLKLTTAHIADFNQTNFNQLYVKKKIEIVEIMQL